jgi:GNAT superfamily N-acetyltransferase
MAVRCVSRRRPLSSSARGSGRSLTGAGCWCPLNRSCRTSTGSCAAGRATSARETPPASSTRSTTTPWTALYVVPEHWGRAIGRGLILEARKRMIKRGFGGGVVGPRLATTAPSASTEPTDGRPTEAGVTTRSGRFGRRTPRSPSTPVRRRCAPGQVHGATVRSRLERKQRRTSPLLRSLARPAARRCRPIYERPYCCGFSTSMRRISPSSSR